MEIYKRIKPKGLYIYTDESKASVNIQKYRKVFDENEISYIYVDFILSINYLMKKIGKILLFLKYITFLTSLKL